MTLLITVIAAIAASIVWYLNDSRKDYKLGTLALIYWGASLMWLMDFVFEYAELKAEYFTQPFADVFNDAVLGISVVAIGLIAWLIVLLVKDPKGLIKRNK